MMGQYAADQVAAVLREQHPGSITLTRSTPGTPEAETPWIPGAPTLDVYALDARVDGVSAQYVDGTTIVATDLVAIASPKAVTADGAVVDIVPRMGDTLTINGAPRVVKRVTSVPATGPVAMFQIFVAS